MHRPPHLQQLQTLPPAFLLENVAMQFTSGRPSEDFCQICGSIGAPVTVDAARLGAGAHRLRNYWTNLCSPSELQLVLNQVERDPHLAVQLPPGRSTQICTSVPGYPYYPANVVGEPIKVLPTLVSFVRSHAFRDGGPGMVIGADGALTDLTIEEREVALGYQPGDTAAVDPETGQALSFDTRHTITGACMDACTLESIIASSLALQLHHLSAAGPTVADYLPTKLVVGAPVVAAAASSSGGGVEPTDAALFAEEKPASRFFRWICLSTAAEAADAAGGGPPDVWDDPLCMEYLREGKFSDPTIADTSPQARARATKRARSYAMVNGKLYRQLVAGERREVPPPADRKLIVQRVHERCGHFGRKRTTYLVLQQYWWAGLYKDVRSVIKCCAPCHQVQATFNHTHPVLNPLPMMGSFYRWHLDLAGPFPETEGGHRYVILAIEAWHKFAVLGLLRSKAAAETRAFFLHSVLSVFGACAEVVTDQGMEWEAEFHDLLTDAFIDHRTTSANHPQANGQVERLVKTLKKSLQKHAQLSTPEGSRKWDELVPWIQLGYNASPHASTKFAPYELLFAVPPTVPPNIKRRLETPLDFEDPELAAEALLLRAGEVRRSCVIAGQNLAIQQHRDTLRYARLRGAATGEGGYSPKLLRFEPGDYVYVKRNVQGPKGPNSFTPAARDEILKVLEVRDSGVLLLVGADGVTVAENSANCAPCHLPVLDGGQPLAPRVREGDVNQCCEVCRYPHNEHIMLLCDSCGRGFHTYCLVPPLESVPEGDWICSECQGAGVTARLLTPQVLGKVRKKRGRPPKRTDAAAGAVPVPVQLPPSSSNPVRRGRRVRFADEPGGANPPDVAVVPVSPASHPAGLRRSSRLVARSLAAGVDLPPASLIPYTLRGLTQVLTELMPGEWPVNQVNWILRGCLDALRPPEFKVCPALRQVDVEELLVRVDLSLSANVLDPFAAEGVVATVFRQRGLYVIENDLDPATGVESHFDALQPASYDQFEGRVHAVVCDPPWAVLDLAVPMISSLVQHVACFRVPASYLCEPHEARARFMGLIEAQGRFAVEGSAHRAVCYAVCVAGGVPVFHAPPVDGEVEGLGWGVLPFLIQLCPGAGLFVSRRCPSPQYVCWMGGGLREHHHRAATGGRTIGLQGPSRGCSLYISRYGSVLCLS